MWTGGTALHAGAVLVGLKQECLGGSWGSFHRECPIRRVKAALGASRRGLGCSTGVPAERLDQAGAGCGGGGHKVRCTGVALARKQEPR